MLDETGLALKPKLSLNAIVNGRFRSESSKRARYCCAFMQMFPPSSPRWTIYRANDSRSSALTIATLLRDRYTCHLAYFRILRKCPRERETARRSRRYLFIQTNARLPWKLTSEFRDAGMFLKSTVSTRRRRRGRDALKSMYVAEMPSSHLAGTRISSEENLRLTSRLNNIG